MAKKVLVADFCVEVAGAAYEAYIEKSGAFRDFFTDGPADFHIVSDLDFDAVSASEGYKRRKILYEISFEGINCDFAEAAEGADLSAAASADELSDSVSNAAGKVPDKEPKTVWFTMADPSHGTVLVQSWRIGEGTVHSTSAAYTFTVTRFALWMAFNMLMIGHKSAAVHSSVNVCNGMAVMCLGESGTGKSTHTRLLRENFPEMFLLNDDSPFVRISDDGSVRVYGSPWSGKTPCYKQMSYPLKAIMRLSQAPFNRIRELSPLAAIGAVLPSAPPAFNYLEETSDLVCSLISDIVSHSSFYHLECLPDAAAAHLSYKTIFGDETKIKTPKDSAGKRPDERSDERPDTAAERPAIKIPKDTGEKQGGESR